ncbi:YfjI family protein [Advenella sp. RU8]|uniref:YfjI family protein n=1 Tax=Advenella sp. RU8 TaxID=3399575 RepID=UPI003AAAE018
MSAAILKLDDVPATEWPDPLPLVGSVYDPEPYPLDALPQGIKAAVLDVQKATQAPLAMIATSALTALSLAGQAHINVARNKHLTGPVSLFGLVLAESGERKSTVDWFFTRPIREYETQQAESMKADLANYHADLQSWESKKAGCKEAIKQAVKNGKTTDAFESNLRALELDKPEPPKVPRLIYGDFTPEELTYSLATRWPSGGVVSDEAGSVFGSHGMGADSVMRNLAAMNTLWGGGTHTVSRRTSASFSTRNARLVVSLLVQLPVLVDYMRKAGELARGSGFLARFLVAWPESTQGTRQYQEPNGNMAGLTVFTARLTQLLNMPVQFDETGHGLSFVTLELTPEAKSVWVSVYNAIESELAPLKSLADVKDVASKTGDNAARIAALFHLFETGTIGDISRENMKAACAIAMWHLSESRRLLTELQQAPEISLAAKLDAWLIEQCNEQGTNCISTGHVLQRFPSSRLRKLTHLLPVLQELIDVDRASLTSEGRKKLIVVNPKLLKGG